MSVTERLDRMQRRHPGLGFPLAVLYKFVDDQGSYLAALITYYDFLSLFPLLLLLTSVLGFVLGGDAHLQQRVLNSTLSQFPVIGSQLGDPKGLRGSGAGLVIGLLGAVYGGLGVAQAGQNAMNAAWHVPRNNRPNPIKARLRSLLLLATRTCGGKHCRSGYPTRTSPTRGRSGWADAGTRPGMLSSSTPGGPFPRSGRTPRTPAARSSGTPLTACWRQRAESGSR